jgi:hypothetical protein
MRALRPLSARPELLLDAHAVRLGDPTTQSIIGIPAPFGRERLVFALPLAKSVPPPLVARVVTDDHGVRLADADGNLIGAAEIWIPRLVYATKTEDTRRL